MVDASRILAHLSQAQQLVFYLRSGPMHCPAQFLLSTAAINLGVERVSGLLDNTACQKALGNAFTFPAIRRILAAVQASIL
eukprot:1346571-Karenia_brevis.AAC.1